MTKHSDDIRRGLRNPRRYDLLDDVGALFERGVRQDDNGRLVLWSEVEPLLDELYVLRNKVEWLQQAERLVIWDGQQWRVRHQSPKQ